MDNLTRLIKDWAGRLDIKRERIGAPDLSETDFRHVAELLPGYRPGRILITFSKPVADYFKRFGFMVEVTRYGYFTIKEGRNNGG